MTLPLNTPIEVDAELRCETYQPPLVLSVQITRFDGQRYDLRLKKHAPDLQTGAQTTLRFGEGQEASLVVVDIDGLHVAVSAERGETNKRSFPRMLGSISFRYLPVSPHSAERHIRDWLLGVSAPDERWRSPDPFMNFSASGLRFQVDDPREIGDILLIEVGVPGGPERWRGTARVVRQEPDGQGVRFVSIRFLDLPAEAMERIQSFRHQLQDAIS